MSVLGLHVTGDQTSACLVTDGIVEFGVAEERLNREKRSKKFPINAVKFCLEKAGLKDLQELSAIAVSWNPSVQMDLINMSGFTSWRRYDPEWLYIIPNNLISLIGKNISKHASVFKWDSMNEGKVYFVNHHLSHLSQSVFQSGFEECAALIADEYGEYASITLAKAKGNSLEIIKQIPFPHSLGAFYATFTELLGFQPNMDEWKVMGMAAYGDSGKYYPQIKKLVGWNPEELDLDLALQYFNFYNMKIATYCTPRLEKLLGIKKRNPEADLEQYHYDIAASLQRVFEEVVFDVLCSLHKLTNSKNIVLGGGIFMNSLFNGKVLERTDFDDIFVPYAAADNGAAMGAALWVSHVKMKQERRIGSHQASSPYIGPNYSQGEIEQVLNKYKIKYERSDNVVNKTAEFIDEGKVVGWLQGSIEYGERALGNRSILADPRKEEMKEVINAAVKYREHFRPFAPSILEEKAAEYFEIPPHVRVPYMEQVYRIKENKRHLIPAVTHNDGTGRLQTVNKELNPLYYELIVKFEELTGIPVLLNTSFNIQGEPIVCSPTDAIRTFFSCGIDVLVMGNYIVKKS